MRGKTLFFLCILSLLADASFIRMDLTFSVPEMIDSDTAFINVSIRNSGDEVAKDVQLDLLLPDDLESQRVFLGSMDPMKPKSHTFKIDVDEDFVGQYPVVLKTHYADANSYPFSIVTGNILRVKKISPVLIKASAKTIQLSANTGKTLEVEVLNMAKDKKEVSVSLYLPDEIKSSSYSETVTIGAQDRQVIEFDLENLGALPGSSYFVVISTEYVEEGVNLASVSSSRIDVVDENVGGSKINLNQIEFVLLVVFIIIFLVSQFKKD